MKRFLIMTIIMTSIVMASCNVTRIITNESQYLQRGDTSVVIQTKTGHSPCGSTTLGSRSPQKLKIFGGPS